MHEHASLRRALEKRDLNKFSSHQQQRFKKDPVGVYSLEKRETLSAPTF